MRFLFDIVHPAHVHFYRHVIAALHGAGHETLVVGRDKDVTSELLESLAIEHVIVGKPRGSGRIGQATELATRVAALWRRGRRFRAQAVLTRNPAGVQAARLLGIPGVFDTDDGRAAGIHFRLAAPFARFITTPDCSTEDYGRKHVRYPGYKQLAYLHPDHFRADASVRGMLGLAPDERLFLVRFVAMQASHDAGESGLPFEARQAVVERLRAYGRVLLSCEGEIPEAWRELRMPLPASRLHDILATCDLLVGDSQTMAAEAAVLGTPSLRASSFSGRLDYLNELENRYRLTRSFRPDEAAELLQVLDEWLAEPALGLEFERRRTTMLADKRNVADWYTQFALGLASGGP